MILYLVLFGCCVLCCMILTRAYMGLKQLLLTNFCNVFKKFPLLPEFPVLPVFEANARSDISPVHCVHCITSKIPGRVEEIVECLFFTF